MGCFFPKYKSKVAQADQYGAKFDHLSNNKPVVLPDPYKLAGQQSSGLVPASASHGGSKKGGTGWSPSSGSAGAGGGYSTSRVIDHHHRTLSAPRNTASPQREAGASVIPFSAPLPSRGPFDTPSSGNGSPLYWPSKSSSVGASEPDRRFGIDNKRSSFNDKKSFGGPPVRLPKPLTGGHPLPLPYSPDRSDGGSFGLAAGLTSPSPNRGREGYGSVNSAYRMLAMGGYNPMDAKPLPPPALPTESRTPVRGFSYAELSQCFNPEFFLGDGVFGTAYRTWVDDGENKKIEVAVVCSVAKGLQGQKEWMAEVNWLARLQDRCLCKMIGYCSEDSSGQDGEIVPRGTRRLLVYEYLCNGSLDKYLKGNGGPQLEWSTRMRVALDIAQGLVYLHDKAPFQVVCRDLSTTTIQLDKDFRAKLSGFGLARCGPEGDQAPPMTGPYVAPESALSGLVTLKSNVWSFGVVLLEMLTGRRHMDPSHPLEQQNLVQLTKPFLRDEGKLFLIIDPELNGRYSGRGALKLANLAFLCLQKEASLRPSLSKAVEVLKSIQVDEDSVLGDLKKSRSFSQSVTSPVSYSRSTTDVYYRQFSDVKHSGELKPRDLSKMSTSGSLGSSPSRSEMRSSGDLKLRERELQRLVALGSAIAGPAFGDSRQPMDLKQVPREGQKLPTPAQSNSRHREPQKLGGPLGEPGHLSENKQPRELKLLERKLQKLASLGSVSAPSSISDSSWQSVTSKSKLQGNGVQKLPTPELTESLNSTNSKQPDPQRLPVPAQLIDATRSPDMKEQGSDLVKLSTPPAESIGEGAQPSDVKQQQPEAWCSNEAFELLQPKEETASDASDPPPESSTPLALEWIPPPSAVEPDSKQEEETSEPVKAASTPPLLLESATANPLQQPPPPPPHDTLKSARPAASARASCAPALTFDPPMLREAF